MFTSGQENAKQGNRKLTFLVMPFYTDSYFFCLKHFYNMKSPVLFL